MPIIYLLSQSLIIINDYNTNYFHYFGQCGMCLSRFANGVATILGLLFGKLPKFKSVHTCNPLFNTIVIEFFRFLNVDEFLLRDF